MVSVTFPRYNTIACTADTIADLREFPVTDIVSGMIAHVAGQLDLNDGNGGIFIWDEGSVAADNGLTIVAPTGLTVGRWVRFVAGVNGSAASAIGLFTDLADQTIPESVTRVVSSGFEAHGVGSGVYIADDTADAALATAHPRFCKADGGGRYFRLLPDANGMLLFTQAELAADSDDQVGFDAAAEYQLAIGAKGIVLDKSQSALRALFLPDPGWWSPQAGGDQGQPVTFSAGTRVDTSNTVLSATAGEYATPWAIHGRALIVSAHEIDAAFDAGDVVIPLATTTALAAGQVIMLRAGDIDGDAQEPVHWHMSRIHSVSAGVSITIEDPVTFEFDSGALSASEKNKHVYRLVPITDELDYPITLAGGLGENGIGVGLTGGFGARVPSIVGPCPAACALVLQYSTEGTTDLFQTWDNEYTGENRGSAFRCAETDWTFNRYVTRNISGFAGALEAGSHVKIHHATDWNSVAEDRVLFNLGSNSTVQIDRMEMRGLGGQRLFNYNQATGNLIQVRNMDVECATDPLSIGEVGKNITGSLRYAIAGQPEERYEVAKTVTRTYTFPLRDSSGGSKTVAPPHSIITGMRCWASTAGLDGVTGLSVARSGFTVNATLLPDLEENKWVDPVGCSWDFGTGFNVGSRDEAAVVFWSSDGSGSLAGEFLTIEVSYIADSVIANDDLESFSDDAVVSMMGERKGSVAFNPPSLASGAVDKSAFVACQGAAPGDIVVCSFTPEDQAIQVTGIVPSYSHYIQFTFKNLNPEGGADPAIDLGAGTINYRLFKA